MIDILVLSFVLSKDLPMKCRTDEHDQIVCFDSNQEDTTVADVDINIWRAIVTTSSEKPVISITDFSPREDFAFLTVAERFHRLAAQWSAETPHVSSSTRAISNSNYQAIIRLGWDVVPLMLKDLQNNQGYWYPALYAITGIRPFDRRDAGNVRRMSEAWLDWGRKKNLV